MKKTKTVRVGKSIDEHEFVFRNYNFYIFMLCLSATVVAICVFSNERPQNSTLAHHK